MGLLLAFSQSTMVFHATLTAVSGASYLNSPKISTSYYKMSHRVV